MLGVINDETRGGWQSIADMLSRQRPYPGRTATVVRGRKMLCAGHGTSGVLVMTAEETAKSIGESPSCGCGCEQCGRDIYTLYRVALDQAAWIREIERRLLNASKATNP